MSVDKDIGKARRCTSCTEESEKTFVTFNVCGMTYVTLRGTLDRFPDTLLGNPSALQEYYVPSKQAYFFDRHRQSFEAILYYYQTNGVLNRPKDIPFTLFAEEISFYGLSEETFRELKVREGYIPDEVVVPHNYWQRKLWELFEMPDSSYAARLLAVVSTAIIVLSIVVFCVETMPAYRLKDATTPSGRQQPWFLLELGCFVWFTIEYMLRLVASPSKWDFIRSFLNVIDILAILPYFVTLSLKSKRMIPLPVLRAVWLFRVFRVFKLSRHSRGLQILGHTLRASVSELCMLVFFLFVGIVLFSSAIFYAEKDAGDLFISIPDAFWYCLVTMTTVGYGDKVPSTLPGKVIGSLCAVSGVLTIALPVPVIVSNFEFFYKRERAPQNIPPRVPQNMPLKLIQNIPLKDDALKNTGQNGGSTLTHDQTSDNLSDNREEQRLMQAEVKLD